MERIHGFDGFLAVYGFKTDFQYSSAMTRRNLANAMFWAQKVARDPVAICFVLFSLLSLIWPWIFIILLLIASLILIFFRVTGFPSRPAVKKHPWIAFVLVVGFGMALGLLVFVVIPSELFQAWNTGVIKSTRSKVPDLIYNFSENPVSFAVVLFSHFLFELGLLLTLFWLFIFYVGENRAEAFFENNPKWATTFAAITCSVLAAGIFVSLPFNVFEAWTTGIIVDVRRRAPDLVFVFSENPVGYWYALSKQVIFVLGLWILLFGFGYLWWSVRHIPVKRRRKFTDPIIPMELTPEEAAKYRRTMAPQDRKQF